MAGKVLQAVLSAWLFVGKIVTDAEGGVQCMSFVRWKKGQLERVRAEMVMGCSGERDRTEGVAGAQ